MMKTKTASTRWLLASAALAALAAGTATATDTPASAAAPQAQSGVDNGVRAYIDPATGKLRQPTAAERAEEAQQTAQAAQARKGRGVRFVKRADGTVRAEDLEGRLMESVVVQRNADGSLSYGYVGGDAGQVDPAKAPVNVQSEEK